MRRNRTSYQRAKQQQGFFQLRREFIVVLNTYMAKYCKLWDMLRMIGTRLWQLRDRKISRIFSRNKVMLFLRPIFYFRLQLAAAAG